MNADNNEHHKNNANRSLVQWLFVATTGLVGVLCTAYAIVAYQSAQAAAAMPFALGGFDERHFWWPAGMAICFLALTVIGLVTKW